MCGIAGFISKEKNLPTAEREVLLDKMCKIIKHRGPDEQGMVVKDRAALGMRRLSIIDLKSGQQPIFDCTGNLAVIFNGEIYNFQELKKDLQKRGHRFRTNSDTETIVHAYEEYGTDCVRHLRGMFAFAVYDFRAETLFLARDRVGKKPLFYSLTEQGNFVFGSELKVLIEHGEIRREIDFSALDAYLTFGYVPEEFCIFKNVYKLAPAHFLLFKDGQITTQKYWDFDYSVNTEIKSENEYIEGLREKIREAVKVRLISEVPLGAFLSGGIDSSSIVAFMSQVSELPVKTFSIGFNEDTFNELKFARLAAKQFRTEHHEFIVTPDLVEMVDELVWHFDEPFADSSALPTFMVSKMAREYVTVVLSGDGGDELFAGYTRYVRARRSYLERLPKLFRRKVLQPLSKVLPHGVRGKYFLYNASLNAVDRYVDSISYFGNLKKSELYASRLKESLNGDFEKAARIFRSIADKAISEDPTDKLLYLDSKTYLPSDILTKVDRMTMAVSLEARCPLLDHELIEFVQKIPSSLKLKAQETKYIFKKAMEGIVPREILYREKQGFGVPIGEWINQQLKDQIIGLLSEKKTVERGYFEQKYVKVLLDEHARSRRDHSHALWILWMLELWHRRFAD
jgi:asparagine synthase (glutamine-hydrolysing)